MAIPWVARSLVQPLQRGVTLGLISLKPVQYQSNFQLRGIFNLKTTSLLSYVVLSRASGFPNGSMWPQPRQCAVETKFSQLQKLLPPKAGLCRQIKTSIDWFNAPFPRTKLQRWHRSNHGVAVSTLRGSLYCSPRPSWAHIRHIQPFLWKVISLTPDSVHPAGGRFSSQATPGGAFSHDSIINRAANGAVVPLAPNSLALPS
jgi:hypothetical protein